MLMQILLRVMFALPDGMVAGLFLAIWIDPHLFSVPFIAGVIGTLGVEAALAFSGILLFAISKTGLSNTQLYFVMAVPLFMALSIVSGIATSAHSLWIYVSFVWLAGNRIANLFRYSAHAKEMAAEAFAVSVLSGIGLMLCSITLSLPLPPFGYDAAAIQSMGLPVVESKRPHSILQFGFVYFAIRTGIKLIMHQRTAAEPPEEKLIRF